MFRLLLLGINYCSKLGQASRTQSISVTMGKGFLHPGAFILNSISTTLIFLQVEN